MLFRARDLRGPALGLLAALAGLLGPSGAVEAAKISVSGHDACTLALTGVIAEGDLETLKALTESGVLVGPGMSDSGPEDNPNTLCLDSPGGSFAEAIRLAEFIFENRIGTRLLSGHSCLSACSILFMFGTNEIGDSFFSTDRAMHSSAMLGFHRPQIAISADASFSGEQIENAFAVAIDSALEMLRVTHLETSFGQAINASLILQMLQHEGEDYFYIDTTGKAGLFDIRITDLAPVTTLNGQAAVNACANLQRWHQNTFFRDQPNDYHFYPTSGRRVTSAEGAVFIEVTEVSYEEKRCVFGTLHETMYGYLGNVLFGCQFPPAGCSLDAINPDEPFGSPYVLEEMSPLVLFDPETPLASVNAAARDLLQDRSEPDWLEIRD